MKNVTLPGLVLLLIFSTGCGDSLDLINGDSDIIINNTAEGDIWIKVDGIRRGRVENDGFNETVWDDIDDGLHDLEAFRDSDYTVFHCSVETNYLDDGEDFLWFLREDDRFSGTYSGRC